MLTLPGNARRIALDLCRTIRFSVVALTAIVGAAFAHADEQRLDYSRDILPILAANCFACHGPDASARQADLRLDQSAAAQEQLPSGTRAIVPGRADESELLRRITSTDTDFVMPPPETRKTLTDAEKQVLRRWIETDAVYAEHWAFTAPVAKPLPLVRGREWVRNEIDAWVLAQLESAGLAPSPAADKATLIRRVSLDLTGLPPTPAELAAFLSDDRPGAYERLVDRLLMSPHFGEKLSQDWLDLARFGDTSGYQDDNDRPNWPYRDAVIRAFNNNLPFDQFTIASLAGDLLPSPTTAQRVLSGFNRLHRYNEEGGSDPEEFRVVYAVDRTNTTAATWMGLTLSCAQCHDHKFDPITQREYYQLLAFFNSLKGEVPVSKGPANPPQIQVPSAEDQLRSDEFARRTAQLEPQIRARQVAVEAAFATWLRQQSDASLMQVANAKPGAIGGTVARSTRRAYYADTKLDSPLSLDHNIRTTGRVRVARAINNDVEVAHFSHAAAKGTPGIGWSVAEGPRFFAHAGMPDGTVLHSAPVAAEVGVEYEWSCSYNPDQRRVTLLLTHDGRSVGATSLLLTLEQRNSGLTMDACGIAFRGLDDKDSPIELYLDDIEYTVAQDGKSRLERFDEDPPWNGEENWAGGHRFGFDALASTSSAKPDLDRLREQYLREHASDLVELQQQLAALRQEAKSLAEAAPLALVWEEMETPRPAHLLVRGDFLQPHERVERNVPAILPPLPADAAKDRLALARWLVSGRHPLTARVAVNRFWKQVFGAGLVRTPEDFGTRGELPTHPGLLDALAIEFQADGWNVKRLLRKMVVSSAYRQSSQATKASHERDPDNRLLARSARYRLSAEEIRDAALTAAGLLNRKVGGRSIYPYQPEDFYRDKEDDANEWKWPVEEGPELYRRGLYTFIRRTSPYPSFQTFDVSGRGECVVARARTNTPLQALVTLNDPVFVEAARVLAERVLREARPELHDQVELLFACVLSRRPADEERSVVSELYRAERERYAVDPAAAAKIRAQGRAAPAANLDDAEVAAWTAVANALLNVDEAISRE